MDDRGCTSREENSINKEVNMILGPQYFEVFMLLIIVSSITVHGVRKSLLFHSLRYFNRRSHSERNFREFHERGSHSRKFISQNISEMTIRESLSREIFSKMAICESLSREIFPKFSQFFLIFSYEKKNNDGKRCFLYKNKVYKNRRKKSCKYCKES